MKGTPSKFGRREQRQRRDGSSFVALPTVVLQSPGYRSLPHAARALLIDLALQFRGRNNGRLVATREALGKLGWKSHDVIQRNLRALEAAELVCETRKGGRNRPAWYALTWYDIEPHKELEIDPKLFRRGGYMKPADAPARGTSPGPSDGPMGAVIGPYDGPGVAAVGPSYGPVKAVSADSLARLTGRYLDMPSAAPAATGGPAALVGAAWHRFGLVVAARTAHHVNPNRRPGALSGPRL